MTTTGTRQTGFQPQFISPMIAAALLVVAVVAAVWYVGRDDGRSDEATTTEAAVAAPATTAVYEGEPARGGLAEAIAERTPAAPPVVYIVASEAAAHTMRMAANEADQIRAAMGERPLDYRTIVLPVDADADVMLAEERRMRDAEGLPQFEVVDLRRSTIEAVTP